jgi:hypothetical protein
LLSTLSSLTLNPWRWLVAPERDDHVATPILVDGFEAAYDRFRSSVAGTAEAFHALVEVLAWAGLGDRLGEDRPPLLQGLYYMRNVVLHQGVDVLHWIFIPVGMLGSMKMGPTSPPHQSWSWPLAGEFEPPRSRGEKPPAGEEEYESLLAGKDAVTTLRQTCSALRNLPAGLGT